MQRNAAQRNGEVQVPVPVHQSPLVRRDGEALDGAKSLVESSRAPWLATTPGLAPLN